MELKVYNEYYDYLDETHGDFIFSEYKYIVFYLIFLRYINLKFEQRYNELVSEYDGFEEDIDFYMAEGILYLPEQSQWNFIIKHKSHKNRNYLRYVLRCIEQENNEDFGSYIINQEKYNLKKFSLTIDVLNNITLNDENCFSKLRKMYLNHMKLYRDIECEINKDNCSTNYHINELLIGLLQPTSGRIYDPISSDCINYIESLKYIKNTDDVSFYGQESNVTLNYIAKMGMHLFDIPISLGEKPVDSLIEDLHKKLKADYIVSDISNMGLKFMNKNVKNEITKKYICNIWVEFLLSHLSEKGKMVITLPDDVFYQSSCKKIMKEFVNNDWLEAMIYLPKQLYNPRAEPFRIWVINKKKRNNNILFINADNLSDYLENVKKNIFI